MWLADQKHIGPSSAECKTAISDMREECDGEEDRCSAPSNVLRYFASHGVVHDDDKETVVESSFGEYVQADFDNIERNVAKMSESSLYHDGSLNSDSDSSISTVKENGVIGAKHDAESLEKFGLPFSEATTAALGLDVNVHDGNDNNDETSHVMMFPTCHVHQGCSLKCRHHTRAAMRTCMSAIHQRDSAVQVDDDGTTVISTLRASCEDRIRDAEQGCGEEESARCIAPIAAGFRAII